MRCALISDGLVTNLIVADPETFDPDNADVIPIKDRQVDIGWTYDGKDFQPPKNDEGRA